MTERVTERKKRKPRPIPEGSNPSLFGIFLRQIRTREGITQDEVGKATGIDESTVARIETGYRKPPKNIEFYKKLGNIPGITPTDIANLAKAPLYDIFGFNDEVINAILSSGGIPEDLIMKKEGFKRVVSEDGVTVFLRVQTDNGILTEKDIALYETIIAAETQLTLRGLNERRARLGQITDNKADRISMLDKLSY